MFDDRILPRMCVASFSQLHDESTVMKGFAPFFLVGSTGWLFRIRQSNLTFALEDTVSIDGDGIDVLQAFLQAEFMQSTDTPRLEEFPHDTIWFFEISLWEWVCEVV